MEAGQSEFGVGSGNIKEMTRHGRNQTASAVYSYQEKKKDSGELIHLLSVCWWGDYACMLTLMTALPADFHCLTITSFGI